MSSDEMNLYSGHCVDPTKITPEDIELVDIAHPLSLICRGTGHVKLFFSVAQHSINCAVEAEARGLSTEVQLACLLHDAGEAYCSDVIRPVKKHLNGYAEIEERIQRAVLARFHVEAIRDSSGWEQVRAIDNDMLTNEACALFTDSTGFSPAPLRSSPPILFRPPEEVEREFTELAVKLGAVSPLS